MKTAEMKKTWIEPAVEELPADLTAIASARSRGIPDGTQRGGGGVSSPDSTTTSSPTGPTAQS